MVFPTAEVAVLLTRGRPAAVGMETRPSGPSRRPRPVRAVPPPRPTRSPSPCAGADGLPPGLWGRGEEGTLPLSSLAVVLAASSAGGFPCSGAVSFPASLTRQDGYFLWTPDSFEEFPCLFLVFNRFSWGA